MTFSWSSDSVWLPPGCRRLLSLSGYYNVTIFPFLVTQCLGDVLSESVTRVLGASAQVSENSVSLTQAAGESRSERPSVTGVSAGGVRLRQVRWDILSKKMSSFSFVSLFITQVAGDQLDKGGGEGRDLMGERAVLEATQQE